MSGYETHEPSRKKEKQWVARKIYICKITGELCHERPERYKMTSKGAVCSDCSVYKEWKEKIEFGED